MNEWIIPALGVAVSPLPVAAMLLVLGGRAAVAKGASLWLAWTAGLCAATVGFVVLADRVGERNGVLRAIALGEILVGGLLVALALRLWLHGRSDPHEASPWLRALDRAGPGGAAALGVALSTLNPKNLALVLSAATAIAAAGEGWELARTAAWFLAVCVSVVSVLLAGRILAPQRTAGVLAALRRLAARHERVLSLVLGVLVGLYFLLDGVRRL